VLKFEKFYLLENKRDKFDGDLTTTATAFTAQGECKLRRVSERWKKSNYQSNKHYKGGKLALWKL